MDTLNSDYPNPYGSVDARETADLNQTGAIGDGSAIYRRMQKSRGGMNWAPAAIVVALAVAGGGAAYALYGHPQAHRVATAVQPAAGPTQTASNGSAVNAPEAKQPAAVMAPTPTSEAAPPAQRHVIIAATPTSSRAVHHEATRRAVSNETMSSPPAPIPYTAAADGSGADASATTSNRAPVNPQPMTAPTQVPAATAQQPATTQSAPTAVNPPAAAPATPATPSAAPANPSPAQ